ncbi:hypothetical protein [Ralstonia pseudosolanacearum]
MSNIHSIEEKLRGLRPMGGMEPPAGGGGPPYNGDMETRVEKLETATTEIKDRLTKIEARLDVFDTRLGMFPTVFATKEDLHKEINAQTWKLVTFVCSFGTALVAATYFIVKSVH